VAVHTPRVLRDRDTRRVATVLFVDVVDSTRVAAEVGDARWRELVGAFRTTVRRQLKRLGGHEVDTAGDGFFATFDNPASALRAAAAIVADVQELGLDVRCGLHTGELERIDGRLGGIAAHIGARVMAHASAAQVLTTGTARDLVVGGAMSFEPVGNFELKGVPGTWALHRLTSVDGTALSVALEAEAAASRRATDSRPPERRRPLILAASVAIVAIAAIAIFAATRPNPGEAAASSPSPSTSGSVGVDPSPAPTMPIALVRIDKGRVEVAESGVVRGDYPGPGFMSVLMADGNMWHRDETEGVLTPIDLATGKPIVGADEIQLPPLTTAVGPAFDALWLQWGQDQRIGKIVKLNASSGRPDFEIDPGEWVYDFAVGDESIFVPTRDGEILEINPINGDIVDRDQTDTAPAYISWWHGLISIADRGGNRYTLFNPLTDQVVDVIEGSGLAYGAGGAQDPQTGTVWVGNRPNRTIQPFPDESLEPEPPIGLAAHPRGIAFGFGAVWVAAEEYVYRIDAYPPYGTTQIPMPEGAIATSIALDEPSETIWVAACHEDCYERD
jgi:class 3 adenylate cyclase